MKKLYALSILLAMAGYTPSFGQTIDADFSPVFKAPAIGRQVAALPNDKLLVSGTFNLIGESATRGFARLLPDGALDATFEYDAAIVDIPRAFAVQEDGKVVIAGRFHDQQGVFLGTLLRLLPDGSLDSSFTAVTDPDLLFLELQILPDQKIFASYRRCTDGQFTGCTVSGLNLYLPDGGPSPEFTPLTFTANSEITSIAHQSANALLVFGGGLDVDGVSQTAFRFDSTGMRDPAFDPNFSATVPIGFAAVLPDATIGWLSVDGRTFNLLDNTGSFQSAITLSRSYFGISAVPATGAFCLRGNSLAYGSTNIGFAESAPVPPGATILDVAAQSDGIVVVGNFREIENQYRPGIFRFSLPFGSFFPDPLFQTQLFGVGTVRAVVRQADGRLVVGGTFDFVNGERIENLARLREDGTVDPSFGDSGVRAQPVNAIVELPDGQLVVAADNNNSSSMRPIAGLTRLNADGNAPLPLAFPQFQSSPETIRYLAVDSLGRFFAGSSTAYNVNSVGWQGLVRYTVAGESIGTKDYNDLYIDSLQRYNGLLTTPDNQLLIYGGQLIYDGSAKAGIVKADTSGQRDATFATDLPDAILVTDATLTAAGELFVSSLLPAAGSGYVLGGLHKLSADGKVAIDFTDELSLDGSDRYRINFVESLPTGAILVAGEFDRLRNTDVPSGRVLLRTDGDPVGEFLPELAAASLQAMTPIDSNSIYLGGAFFAPNGAVSLMRVDLPPLTSSVADHSPRSTGMTLYPNPVAGSSVGCLLERVSTGERLPYQLYELATGRLVGAGVVISAPRIEIPLSPSLPTGRYVLVLRDGPRIYADKLIKE